VATIYTIAKAVYESNASPNKPMGMSGPVVNMFVALFSIFPPIVLHALTSRFLRCLTTRKLIWVFHGTLIVVSVTLYHAYRYNPLEDEDNWRYWDLRGDIDNQYQWELYCLDRPNMVRTNRMIIGLGSFLVAIGLFYILFVWNLFRISIFDAERHKIFRQLHNVWWLIAAGVGFVGMWLCLILFLDLRQELYQNSGATNKDSEWTFGQVLATSTWVPVIADFLHILYLGPERALDRLVSVGYTVVDTRSLDTNEPSEKAGRISGCHTALDTAKNGHTP
jgi:hypothetical protein